MAQQSMKRNPYLADYAVYEGGRAGTRRMTRAEREGYGGRSMTREEREGYGGRRIVRAEREAYGTRRMTRAEREGYGGHRMTRAEWEEYDRRSVTRTERERRRRRKRLLRRLVCGAVLLTGMACIVLVLSGVVRLMGFFWDKPEVDGSKRPVAAEEQTGSQDAGQTVQGISLSAYLEHPAWTENFLTVNDYSRPGDALEEVKNIFVHYTANKGTSAAQNRSYFEQLKDTHERSASAHFIIGCEGEIIQCIPLDEIAYAVQTRNMDSISIECCYLSDDGAFTQETYDSLLALLGWLMKTYDLGTEDILRHYDCGGKKCPVYYVKHEDAWEQLKKEAGEL